MAERRFELPGYRIETTIIFLQRYLPVVPTKIRNRFFELWKRQAQCPEEIALPHNNIKKLRGFTNLWRFRIGNYRLIYRLDGHCITCLIIGSRSSIYRQLNYDPDNELIVGVATALPGYVEYEPGFLDLDISKQLEFEGGYVSPSSSSLPLTITPELLLGAGVNRKFFTALIGVRTENDLLDLTDTVPQATLERVLEFLYPPQSNEERRQRSSVREMILRENFQEFACPIPECNHVFITTRGGWDSHVASLRIHPGWHPNVVDGKERKRLFRTEYTAWFGFSHFHKQDSDIKRYPCPIPGCSYIFRGTKGGWDAHVVSLRRHPDWHSELTDGTERKDKFRQEYSEWFLN